MVASKSGRLLSGLLAFAVGHAAGTDLGDVAGTDGGGGESNYLGFNSCFCMILGMK